MKWSRKSMGAAALLAAFLWGSSLLPVFAEETADTLPAFYDLRLAVPEDRNSGYDPAKVRINPIRHQGIYGTCWAFSAIAAVESNVYTQLQKAGIPYNVLTKPVDLSEWYLAWISAAAPVDVKEDTVPHSRPLANGQPLTNYYVPFAMKVYQGGIPYNEVEVMLANGTGLIWEQGEAVKSIVAPKVYLPPVLQLKNIFMVMKGEQRDTIKRMLREYGAVSFAVNADPMLKNNFATAFYGPKAKMINHGIDIVGWDDDFVFTAKNMGGEETPKQKGAWIIRNSWGEGWGDNGYAYLSYEDKTSMLFTAFDMNPDKGSVSYISTHELNSQLASGDFAGDIDAAVPENSAFGGGYTGLEDAFLTGTGFYANADGMEYRIEVRKGRRDAPLAGTLVYSQQGIFGEDGSSKLAGYRIVPFKQAVYIPKGENYNVTVELNNPQGKTTYRLSPSEVAKEELAEVDVWIRLGKDGSWQRELQPGQKGLPLEFQQGSVKQRLYFKKAAEPMGKEFVATALNDGEKSHAVIDLGRQGELYGQDLLAPDRETLSVMRLELADDSSFSGSIIGEGHVVKEGAGSLTLRGKNTYTGTTTVQEGNVLLAAAKSGEPAALAGDIVLAGGSFGGTGIVQGNIRGKGTLVLNSTAALQVDGLVDLTGIKLSVTGTSQTGTVLIRAGQGITGSHNLPAGLRLSADGREIICR